MSIVWLDKTALLLGHRIGLARFGGADGIRDQGGLESALARPVNKHNLGGVTDICELAAAYGFGIVKNHPFVDGNKRAALTAVLAFLGRNGFHLKASPIELGAVMVGLAASQVTEEAFADWLKQHAAPRDMNG